MSTATRVIKNTGFLYAKMGITMFVSLYTTRLILNSLGASDFGIFNIVGGAIAMLGFLNSAMASATQRFMSYSEGAGDKEKQKGIFNISFILHFLLAFIVGLVLLIAGYFFFNGILNIPADRIYAAKVVYGSLIISTMFTVMTVPYDAVLNAHENMKYYAIVGIIESFLKLGVAVITVYTLLDKLIIYGILMACVPLVTLTIMRIYCHKHYEECVISPRQYWDKSLMKEMTSFAGWSLAGSMGSMVGNYGNGIVLNNFFGTLLNAALGIANQLCGMLMVFSNNMLKALNPVIVKKEGEGNHERMIEFSYTGCKASYLLFAFFCLPCIVETPYILKLWLGTYPEWTILFVRYQLLRTLLEQLTIVLGTTLSATGKIKELNISSTILYLLPIAILAIAFSNGASPAWYYPIIIVIMVVITTIFKLYYCKKYCGLSIWDFSKKIILPCIFLGVVLLIVGFAVQLTMQEGIIRLLLCIICMTLTYVICSYYILNSSEREIIKNMILKLRSKFDNLKTQ